MSTFLNKYGVMVCVLLILATRILQLFTGLPDFSYKFCDADLYVQGTKYMLEYPKSCDFCFNYYLTFIWAHIFTDGSLLQLRVLQLVMDGILYTSLYFFFKQFFSKLAVAVGLLLASLSTVLCYQEFAYNSFSVLFIALAFICIVQSIIKEYKILSVIAGFLLAVNILVRIPNLLDFGMVIIYPISLYFFTSQYNLKFQVKQVLILVALFIGGYIIGLFADYILLSLFGHFNQYVDHFFALFSSASQSVQTANTATSYGSGSLIMKLLYLHETSILYTCCIIAMSSAIAFAYRLMPYKKETGVVLVVCIAIAASKAYYIFYNHFWLSALSLYIASFILYLSVKHSRDIITFLLLAVGVCYVIYPAGSGSVDDFCVPFILPLLLPVAVGTLALLKYKLSCKEFNLNYVPSICFITIAMCVVIEWYHIAMYRQNNRPECNTTVSAPICKSILTTNENAAYANALYKQFAPYTKGKPVISNGIINSIILENIPYGIIAYRWQENDARSLELTYREQNVRPLLLIDKTYPTDKFYKQIAFLGKYTNVICENERYILYNFCDFVEN